MGQVYQCWCRICREINVFPRFECYMFYFLYLFVTYYWLSLVLVFLFVLKTFRTKLLPFIMFLGASKLAPVRNDYLAHFCPHFLLRNPVALAF
jgi:hypothetical protein